MRFYKRITVISLVVWFLSLAVGLASFCYGKEKLQEYQVLQLEKLPKHAYENVSYYRRVFDERGLEMIRDNLCDFVAQNILKSKLMYGTTGEPTSISFGFYDQRCFSNNPKGRVPRACPGVSTISRSLNTMTATRWFEEIFEEYLSENMKSWIVRIKKYDIKHLLQCTRWFISPFVITCYIGFLARQLKGR